ncbi:MAG: hypothetical protein Q8P12_06150, partial [bacterium]|nr:hypothetical protein [bacterium]
MTLAEMEMQKGRARARGSLQRGQAFAAIPQAIAGAASGYLKERQEAPLRELEMRRVQAQLGQAETQTEANRMTLEEAQQAREEQRVLDDIYSQSSDPVEIEARLKELGMWPQLQAHRKQVYDLRVASAELDKKKREEATANLRGFAEVLDFPEVPEPEQAAIYQARRQLALNLDIPQELRDAYLPETDAPTEGHFQAARAGSRALRVEANAIEKPLDKAKALQEWQGIAGKDFTAVKSQRAYDQKRGYWNRKKDLPPELREGLESLPENWEEGTAQALEL